MKPDDLDERMRALETAHDHCVSPGIFMVARLDGRNFTRLTREIHRFDAPFDERMRDHMIETTRHLMRSGFRVSYGYTQSDEISLLLCHQEMAFGRSTSKFNSILAGEASAAFSILVGSPASFDCRISELPRMEDVTDYFRWRQQDAYRNALNGHCYWMLRKRGESAKESTRYLEQLSATDKKDMLLTGGVIFSDMPNWQTRGVGVRWDSYTKEARNLATNEAVVVVRRRFAVELDLPTKEQYGAFIMEILAARGRRDAATSRPERSTP